MLNFLMMVAALIQQLLPLVPAVIELGATIEKLFELGSRVVASGSDPTHEDWAALVSIQSAALAMVRKAGNSPEPVPGNG